MSRRKMDRETGAGLLAMQNRLETGLGWVNHEQAMPELFRHAGLDVAFSPNVLEGQREKILSILPDPASRRIPYRTSVLKAKRQRLVLRLPTSDIDIAGGSFVVKLFPLRSPISRVRHRKYARREFLNLLAAQMRGMPTPEVLAFFQRRRLCLVAGSGLLIEDLRAYRDIASLSEQTDYPTAANSALPALTRLYELGINHVDARDENILIAPGSIDGTDYRVIDWQYASFWPSPRADWLLEHLAAHFIRMSPVSDEVQRNLLSQWMPELHRAANHCLSIGAFAARVRRLLNVRPSTRARMRLQPAV